MKSNSYWVCLLVLLACEPASAGWQPVEELGQAGPTSEMLDCQACSFRFHLRDGQHQGSNQYMNHYYLINRILETRHDGFDGNVYSQQLSASIDGSVYGTLYYADALSYSAYMTLRDLFDSPKNPWAMKISLIRNASIYQLSLSYRFYNESAGANYSATIMLDKDKFVLEANCSPAQTIQGVTATASSSYSTSYGPEKMLDGNESSYWIGGQAQPSYTLDFDLGAGHKVDAVDISWYSSYYAGTDFSVLVSTTATGENFVPVQEHLNAATHVDMGKVQARRVRIRIDAIGNQYYPVIREVKFTGWPN
jgi:hypothetical protein